MRRLREFCRDDRGSVIILFSFLMLAVTVLVGMLGWGLAGWPMTLVGVAWQVFLLFQVRGGRRLAQTTS